MIINFTSKDREPVQKYNAEDVEKWLKTFFIENGVLERFADKYIEINHVNKGIVEISFKDVANSKYSQVYGALIVLLSTAHKSHPSHTSDGSVVIKLSAGAADYNEACKELVLLLKDNLKFHIE